LHLKNVVVLLNRAVPDLLVPMLWMERVMVMMVTMARNMHLYSEAKKSTPVHQGFRNKWQAPIYMF
jgi:hypothetical protein